VSIDALGGSAPLQASGKLADGRFFYFRSRHDQWSFGVGMTEDDAVGAPIWLWSEPFGDRVYEASYMSEAMGRLVIESCADMVEAGVAPPEDHAGTSAEELAAGRFARAMMEDVFLYHDAGAFEAGAPGAPRARTVYAAPIAEARAAYQKRVDAGLHPMFERAVDGLEGRVSGEVFPDRWLLDEPSARRVGRRWAAMLVRARRSEHAGILDQGRRWIARWTPEGNVREGWKAEIRAAGFATD